MDISTRKTSPSSFSADNKVNTWEAFKSLCRQTPHVISIQNFSVTPEISVSPSGKITIGLTAENVPQAGAIAWVASAMKQVMPDYTDMQLVFDPGPVVTKTTFTFLNKEKLQEAVNDTYAKLGGRKKLLEFSVTEQAKGPAA